MGTQHCIIGRVRHAGTHTRAAQGAEIAAREANQRRRARETNPMDLIGVEPTTSSMPWKRSPN